MPSPEQTRVDDWRAFAQAHDDIDARRLELNGQVQGVGFRPFVFRLAVELGLHGTVCNETGAVKIVVQGPAAATDEFQRRLIEDAPPLARPAIGNITSVDARDYEDFRILESVESVESAHAQVFLPPDYYLCPDCATEQSEPTNRRFRYPFINCTQCGPRYTIIQRLPYDRANTSMAGFPLCAECRLEYTNPADRRFHAEPIACPACGPQLALEIAGKQLAQKELALVASLAEINAGRIVAVKGIGGYHLMCDASQPDAVARLRLRKQRPDKPLAVMFPLAGRDGLELVRQCVVLTEPEANLLRSPARPIVLARARDDCALAANIAPGLREFGVFLPYSPLHQVLLNEFGAPLVATSGNISGEPVLTDNAEASLRLAHIADAFLHHDRPIVRPADDSVYRLVANRMRPLRLGRGIAPLELELPWRQPEPVLCVGGHLKTTVTLSWGNRAFVSPHIGEMDSKRSLAVFEQLVADLQSLYGVRASRIVCDAHPGYATHRWAGQQKDLPVSTVWHHQAHASALVAECKVAGPWLVFAWDGVGLGEDRTLWGGEALMGEPGNWRRVSSLLPFRPPGGERAGREPWRSAAALLWQCGQDWHPAQSNTGLARQAWQKNLNCPQTSAAGRLFDAAAALICNAHQVSYEAQGPMQLEALCNTAGVAVSLPLSADETGILRSDWTPLLAGMRDTERDAASRAEEFHSSMARVVVDQSVALRERYGVHRVGLVGGVFQNRLLTELALSQLQALGFETHLNAILPCNDAALSFGQAAEFAASNQPGVK